MVVEPPAIVVLKTPRRDFLQRKTLKNHFTARFDHLDGYRLNGGGFSAQEQFFHRDPTPFFHQSDLSHTSAERVLPGLWGPHEH